MAMTELINILHLEDEPEVSQVISQLLAAEGLKVNLVRMDNEREFKKHLTSGLYEMVIADYALPEFDGLTALKIVRQYSGILPVIIVSGALTDAQAAAMIRYGANDYLMKSNLHRLGAAVRHAVENYRERKRRIEAEILTRRSEIKFRSIFTHATDAIIVTDMMGIIVDYNPSAEKIFGYSPEEAIGRYFDFLLPGRKKDNYQRLSQLLQRIKARRSHTPFRTNGLRKNGEVFPIEISVGNWADDQEEYFFSIIRDVSQRVKTEQELIQSRESLRKLIDNMLDAVVITDTDEHILYVNPSFVKMTGYAKKELLGKSFISFVPSEEIDKIRRETAARKKGKQSVYESQILTKNGEIRDIMISASPNFVSNYNIEEIVAVIHDITQRKKLIENLEKAKDETERLLDSISSILIGVDENDIIRRWNATAEEVFGLSSQQVVGQLFMTCGIQWDWAEILERIAECRDLDTPTRWDDIRYTTPSDHEGFLSVTINPIFDNQHTYRGFLLLAQEVTERKMLESQLSQSQKLESIGQLAAGIAHEINTPIQFVGDNLQFLSDSFADLHQLFEVIKKVLPELSQPNRDFLEQIMEDIDLDYLVDEIPVSIQQAQDGIQRVSKIVKAMKDFSHPGVEEKVPLDINKALQDTLLVSRNEWKYVAEVETDFSEELPAVPCLAGELNQVFLNIIVNAAHAIQEKVGSEPAEKGKIRISTRPADGRVIVSIADTGKGIPPQIQNKIFDPFFTTKEVGKGTGQGLAIAHDVVVNKHNGNIRFETTPGQGTKFIIELPVS
ncbi:MAG: hypothetical protein Kow0037_21790 [Calditrichia bacterium]